MRNKILGVVAFVLCAAIIVLVENRLIESEPMGIFLLALFGVIGAYEFILGVIRDRRPN